SRFQADKEGSGQISEISDQRRGIAVDSPDKIRRIIRILILFLSIVFLFAGFITGGFTDVWSKAVTICRECVGIG
ncbi:MAG: hypothetical protein K5886_09440, partial [Lachnospiraceae bacterium]|nr:hypothetical protein [Lachnospiraceae bacterium]